MSPFPIRKPIFSRVFASALMTASERWRQQLEDWALPQELLDAVPWNPYDWPANLFARRDEGLRGQPTPERRTNEIIRRLSPESVLDIGAGAGGSCLDLAAAGLSLTALERDAGMAAKLRAVATERRLDVAVVEAGWPEAAALVDSFDVVTCSHVIHNVPDIVPFLRAMEDTAERAVVIQEFETHPWAHLRPYYLQLHKLDRPLGPTVEDLIGVLEEDLGVSPAVEYWNGGPPMWFASRAELMTFYGRRLVVPPERGSDLEDVLGPEIVDLPGGRVQLEDRQKRLATIWWLTRPRE